MHLPKTAGMALRLFLGNQYAVSQILPAFGWPELLSVDFSRIEEYRLFQGHFSCSLLDLLPKDVVPIVFLREPVARTISHLKHLRRDPNFHPAHQLAAGRTLDDLVGDDRIMKLCCDSQCALLSYDVPGEAILADLRRVQSEGRAAKPDAFAAKPDLAKAEAMLDRFGFVGFVEDLQDDVMRLSMKFGFHPPREIPKRNHDPEGETRLDSIRPDTLAALRRWNAADIALYETARRRFSGRPRVPRPEVERELLARGTYAPLRRPIEFAISGPFPGSNWYACEDAAHGGHRWTGPLNETTLDLPLASGFDFELSLVVLIAELGDLTARLGDTELPIRRDSSDRRVHRITVDIPAVLVREKGLTSVRFQTKDVFRPSETDIRIMSFMVRELSISQVEPASLTTHSSAATTDRSGEWNMASNEASSEQSKPARLAAAQAASDAKEWHRAAELWDSCRIDFPQDARCWHKSGEAFCHTGMLDRADQILGEALPLFSDDEWTAYWHVAVARARADWPEALRRAERMGRSFPASWRPMVEAADALAGLQRQAESEEIRREALKQFPNEFWTNYGVTRLEAERADPPGAVRIWSELVARFPTQPNAAAALQAAREAARHPLRQQSSTLLSPRSPAAGGTGPSDDPTQRSRGFTWRRRGGAEG